MDHCTVETGLLRKKLCAQHAVAQLTGAGAKSGKFVCKECEVALREQKKTLDALARNAPPAARKPPGDFTPSKNRK